jgi:hypothetical protein
MSSFSTTDSCLLVSLCCSLVLGPIPILPLTPPPCFEGVRGRGKGYKWDWALVFDLEMLTTSLNMKWRGVESSVNKSDIKNSSWKYDEEKQPVLQYTMTGMSNSSDSSWGSSIFVITTCLMRMICDNAEMNMNDNG